MFIELASSKPTSRQEAVEIARALRELADRQWHNYERAAPDVVDSLTRWIVSNWDPHVYEFVVNITAVMALLGLSSALGVLESSLKENLSPEIRSRLEQFIATAKPSIDDPYGGMP